MSKTKMTIHRALSELKLIDARIAKQISEIEPVGLYQKGKLIGGFLRESEFNNSATSSFQAINDLIERKVKIKTAIVKSNSKTMVEVGDKNISVADAISYKSIILHKKALIHRLADQYKKYTGDMNNRNEQVEANCQAIITAAVGKDNIKSDSKDIDAIRKPYIDAQEFHLADPIKVAEKVKEMETEISDFESDIDSVLSETNAVTFIELE